MSRSVRWKRSSFAPTRLLRYSFDSRWSSKSGCKAAKKKELAALQKKERDLIQKKIRIGEKHISAAERKRRTRRLILMGSYMEHVTANDEAAKDHLMKGLDSFLQRDRDRKLFDLPTPTGNPL